MKGTINKLTSDLKDAAREAVVAIMSEMGVDNCVAKLQTLPAQIQSQEAAVADARRGLEEAKVNLDLSKQIIVAAVAEEVNGNGKARYTNAEARSAEVTRRLAVGEGFQTAKQAFQAAEDEVSQAQFELSRLQNDFGAAKIVGQMLAAKMNLLAGL